MAVVSTEQNARDYEERVAAAGGPDALTASLIKAVRQARRGLHLVVVGLILLLGTVAVLAVTVVNTNRTARLAADSTRKAEDNRRRSLANSRQANEIVRCLTSMRDPGKCLGLTVPPGSPGSQGLRGSAGTPGLPGPRGARGPAGRGGARGLLGAAGMIGPGGRPGLPGQAGGDGPRGTNGTQGDRGRRGDDGATGPAGPAGDPGAPGSPGAAGPAGAPGLAPTTVTCGPPDSNGLQTCASP